MSDAEFGRRLVDGAWLYEGDTLAVALDWALRGFNIVALDDYLDEPGWDSTSAQANRALLVKRRAQALAAHRTGGYAGAEPWINYLQAALQLRDHRDELLQLRDHRDELLPLARLGDAHKDEQSARAKLPRNAAFHNALQAMVTRPENRELRAKELWPKVFHTLEELDFDPSEAIDPDTPANPAYIYGIDHARRLTFATFKVYVSKWRPKKKLG